MPHFTRFLFCIFFLRFVTPLLAQQPLNLDFETLGAEGSARPWGWSIDNYTNVALSLDSSQQHRGHFSLFMDAKAAEIKEEQLLGYGIEPFELLNKTVKVEGWIKTEALTGFARIKLEYAGGAHENDNTPFDTVSVKLSGTNDWTKISLSLRMPAYTNMLYFSLCTKGEGKAWFDDFSLYAGGKKKSSVRVAEPFTRAQLKWLKQQVSPVRSVDASRENEQPLTEDLAAFKKAAGDATIIAIGESTHGTSEFFRMKHRLLEYAVNEMGVRVFGIEDNQLIVEKVNRFVHTGEGTARQSMYGMFSVWQNKEVCDMIQWVRDYNVKHPGDMVDFTGFDMQEVNTPLDSLYAFLRRQDKEFFSWVNSLLADLKANNGNLYSASDSTRKAWFDRAEKVLNEIRVRKTDWLAEAHSRNDSLRLEWGLQYANLVKQFAQSGYLGYQALYRDAAMAENISWLLSQRKPGTRILVWAHDYHISRGEAPVKEQNVYNGISMGSHLARKYGTAYKCFGQFTYTGTYWAQLSYFNFHQQPVPLCNSPEGSLDEALHRLALAKKTPGLFLDLKGGREQDWLAKPLPMRFANHVCFEYSYWTRYAIPYQFDGIFFTDVTHAAASYVK